MAESIFDWENDDDKPDVQAQEPQHQPGPFEKQAEPVEFQPEPPDHRPGPVEYSSEPQDEHPWEYEPEPIKYLPESAESLSEPFGYHRGPLEFEPASVEETARRGGLAWSAGIVFFSSVVFMLFLGWIADLLIGSSPWGIVGGIVLGSIIGFIQFFRITSQIFNTKKAELAMRPLMPPDEDEK